MKDEQGIQVKFQPPRAYWPHDQRTQKVRRRFQMFTRIAVTALALTALGAGAFAFTPVDPFKQDPKAVLSKQMGRELPDWLNVQVVEESVEG